MPTRSRDRAGLALVSLTLGAIIAGSATVAAQPRVTAGVAQAGSDSRVALAHGQATATSPVEAGTPAPSTTPPPTPTSTSPSTSTPTPAPAGPPSPAAASASQRAGEAARVVELVNAERRRAGCQALAVDQRLVGAAQAHSTDMATNGYFSHTSLDGRTFADRIRAAGYPRPGAENIARGQRSADAVVRAWMRSRGHRANILNCDLVAIGVGLDTRGWYWTQDFGR